jgi:hypothetical protein
MKLIKRIYWEDSEFAILKELQKWLTLTERLTLAFSDIKAAERLAYERTASAGELQESLQVWRMLLDTVVQQLETAKFFIKDDTTDTDLGQGFDLREILKEPAEQAIADINKAINLSELALRFLQGELLHVDEISEQLLGDKYTYTFKDL